MAPAYVAPIAIGTGRRVNMGVVGVPVPRGPLEVGRKPPAGYNPPEQIVRVNISRSNKCVEHLKCIYRDAGVTCVYNLP